MLSSRAQSDKFNGTKIFQIRLNGIPIAVVTDVVLNVMAKWHAFSFWSAISLLFHKGTFTYHVITTWGGRNDYANVIFAIQCRFWLQKVIT